MSEGRTRTWHDRIVELVLGATVLTLPLILMPTGYDAYRFPKVLVLRSAAIILVTIYGSRWVWGWGGAFGQILLRDRLVQTAFLIVAWCALAAALSPQPAVSLWAVGDLLAGLILFFSALDHGRRSGSPLLVYLTLIPGFMVVGIVILQFLNVWHPLVTVEELARLTPEHQQSLVEAAVLGNRDDVGVYLLLPLAAAISMIRKHPALSAIGGLFVMGGIVLSATISAIAVGLGLLVVEIWRAFEPGKAKISAIAALLVLAIGISSSIALQPRVRDRILKHANDIRTLQLTDLARGREASFTVAGIMVKENPLFGVGPGRFPAEFTETARNARVEVPEVSFGPTYFDMVHNDYLEIAAEAGLPALLAAMAFLALYLARLRVSRFNEHFLVRCGWLAAVGIGTIALAQFPLQLAAVYGTMAILCGVSLGYVEHFEG